MGSAEVAKNTSSKSWPGTYSGRRKASWDNTWFSKQYGWVFWNGIIRSFDVDYAPQKLDGALSSEFSPLPPNAPLHSKGPTQPAGDLGR